MPYHSSFSLDAIGQPSLGVVAGGPFGTGLAGGVSMIFGDQLSDRQIFAAIQANGTVKDIGGALQYYNMKNRWNYGMGIEHVPVSHRAGVPQDTTIARRTRASVAGYSVNQLIQRVYIDQAAVFTQYPFSTTKRLEFTANITHYGFDTRAVQDYVRRQHDRRPNGRETDIDLQADLVRRAVARARRGQLVLSVHVARAGAAVSHSGHADVRLGDVHERAVRLPAVLLPPPVHAGAARPVARPLRHRRRRSEHARGRSTSAKRR